MSVLIETSLGDIVIDLYLDYKKKVCYNFLKLCKIKYYNMCLIHTVQPNFTFQTGNPSNDVIGGHSIFLHTQGKEHMYFSSLSKVQIKHFKVGTVSMVSSGDRTLGSQFFITLAPDLKSLDESQHSVFGEVTSGFATLKRINECACNARGRPLQDVWLHHTIILQDPFEDCPQILSLIPAMSPSITEEQVYTESVAAFENVGKDTCSEEERLGLESEARAKLLEIVGDIPYAEAKPQENELFVCKLNPVTTAEDLELIFSRFGEIKECHVVKDYKTGASLCYAFLTFARVEDCENAYFKMDNTLIDDRRIHVDFSQSLSKMNVKFGQNAMRNVKHKEETKAKIISDAFDSLASGGKKSRKKKCSPSSTSSSSSSSREEKSFKSKARKRSKKRKHHLKKKK